MKTENKNDEQVQEKQYTTQGHLNRNQKTITITEMTSSKNTWMSMANKYNTNEHLWTIDCSRTNVSVYITNYVLYLCVIVYAVLCIQMEFFPMTSYMVLLSIQAHFLMSKWPNDISNKSLLGGTLANNGETGGKRTDHRFLRWNYGKFNVSHIYVNAVVAA